jgi:hypothetical protein
MDGRTKLRLVSFCSFRQNGATICYLVFTVSLQCDEPNWAQDNGRICARRYKRLHLQGRECLPSLFVHILVPVQFVESIDPEILHVWHAYVTTLQDEFINSQALISAVNLYTMQWLYFSFLHEVALQIS